MPFYIEHLVKDRPKPITVPLDATVKTALELMIEYDFSQLPVITADNRPLGMVTSDSILRALHHFGVSTDKLRVRHALIKARLFRSDESLFDLLDDLRDAYAVLIVDGDGVLLGVVTNYDTTEYFRRRAEDIMLAEDIETTLRDYIEAVFRNPSGEADRDALNAAIEEIMPSGKDLQGKFRQALSGYLAQQGASLPKLDNQLLETMFNKHLYKPVQPKAFEELTLYDYIQLFRKHWSKYSSIFELDLDAIDKLFNEVRLTRNAIAHFREVLPHQREQLKFCADLLAQHQSALFPETSNTQVVSTTELIGDTAQATVNASVVEVDVAPVAEEPTPDESRYAPLAIWLQSQTSEQDKLLLTFRQVEEIIGAGLPPSARQHRNWWANDSVGHTQSQQWLDAGWRVSNINMTEERVVFSPIGERQGAYINFFSALASELQQTDLKIKPGPLLGRHWFGVIITSGQCPNPVWLGFSFARKKQFRVEHYIDLGSQEKTKLLFDNLYTYKSEIESKLGEPLSWERLDSKRASRIALYHAGAITNGEDELSTLRSWAVKSCIKFYEAIVDKIVKVGQSVE